MHSILGLTSDVRDREDDATIVVKVYDRRLTPEICGYFIEFRLFTENAEQGDFDTSLYGTATDPTP